LEVALERLRPTLAALGVALESKALALDVAFPSNACCFGRLLNLNLAFFSLCQKFEV